MIDPAEHTGLVGHLMGRLQVRKRFQAADADDIEGDMLLALCVAAKNFGEVGKAKFGTYAWSCVRPIAASGSRHHCRFRRRTNTVRGVDVTRRVILFSEIGPWFTRSKYFATIPPAEHEMEVTEVRACAAAEVGHMLAGLTSKFRLRNAEIIRMRFGLDRWDEMTLDRIGRHFGITRERVREIEAKALREMQNNATAELEAL